MQFTVYEQREDGGAESPLKPAFTAGEPADACAIRMEKEASCVVLSFRDLPEAYWGFLVLPLGLGGHTKPASSAHDLVGLHF